MKKALASDFDNTLYFSDIKFREEDIRAIRQFQSSGGLFGVCTGRALYPIEKDTDGFIDCDFYLLITGALILDRDKKIIDAHPVGYDVAYDIVRRNLHQADIVFFQTVDNAYVGHVRNGKVDFMNASGFEEISRMEIFGCSVMYTSETVDLYADKAAAEVRKLYPDLDTFRNVISFDVVRKGCSKGESIRMLKKLESIDLIGAIGDSYNDLTMLEAADVAFTFPDSPQPLKDAADYIVSGVAEAISIMESL